MSGNSLRQAFDELRFGREATLNLREQQPTALQAVNQTEQWLRRLQVEGKREALIITGRGNRSPDGYSTVREAVVKLFPSLRRRNVITGYVEHTPGSFVVSIASVNAMLGAVKRRRERTTPPRAARRGVIEALDEETQRVLHELALTTLSGLGVVSPTPSQLNSEVARQFSRLVAVLPEGDDREALLQQAACRALEELEEL